MQVSGGLLALVLYIHLVAIADGSGLLAPHDVRKSANAVTRRTRWLRGTK